MRVLFVFLIGLLVVVSSQTARADLAIFACEPEWAALAGEIGGARVKVFAATSAVQDPHRIEARPSLIARFRSADLAICTGAELEIGWLPILQRQAGNSRLAEGQPGFFAAADFARMRDLPSKIDRSMGDIHAAGNPHLHLDPHNIALVAAALAERMAQLDPASAGEYRASGSDFLGRWERARAGWEEKAAPLRGVPVAVQHRDWVYLTGWLGLTEVVALEPRPGIPPGAAHLATVLDLLRQTPVKAVLVASYQDAKPAQWISERTAVPVLSLPFTVGGSPRATTLFTLFDDTVAMLLTALH